MKYVSTLEKWNEWLSFRNGLFFTWSRCEHQVWITTCERNCGVFFAPIWCMFGGGGGLALIINKARNQSMSVDLIVCTDAQAASYVQVTQLHTKMFHSTTQVDVSLKITQTKICLQNQTTPFCSTGCSASPSNAAEGSGLVLKTRLRDEVGFKQ